MKTGTKYITVIFDDESRHTLPISTDRGDLMLNRLKSLSRDYSKLEVSGRMIADLLADREVKARQIKNHESTIYALHEKIAKYEQMIAEIRTILEATK